MNDAPTVSVILPFRNAPKLSEAVESILNQSFSDFELILVNNEPERDNEYLRTIKDHRIRVIKEPRRGVVYAINRGINAASGEFIMRMDADDISYPDRIQNQVGFLYDNPSISVVSGQIQYQGSAQNVGFRMYVAWLNSIHTSDQIRYNQFVEFPLANPSLMYRRSVFKDHGMYREGDFPEDYDHFLRLQSAGIQMGKVKDPVIKWVDSPTRLTRMDSRYSSDAFFKLKAQYLAKWLKENNEYHPDIIVWGGSRLSRKRSQYLQVHGVSIKGYIDLKESGKNIPYTKIGDLENVFIVSYVSSRGARSKIRSYLLQHHYVEGKNFILAS
ncbi:MAG: glycosyltransferase [Bacteroidota bacterium]